MTVVPAPSGSARATRAAPAGAQVAARRVHRDPNQPVTGGVVYAGVVTRALAFALDAAVINLAGIMVAVVATLVFSVLPESDELRSAVVALGGVLYVAWLIGYFVGFWTTAGETPGNRAMRIRVAREHGDPLRARHAFLRLLGILLSLPLLAGFVPILLTERRRGLHDMLAGTVVVATARRRR